MTLLLILLGLTLTSSGGDPAWEAIERLRRGLAAGGETADTFNLSEASAGGGECESVVEIRWRLPEAIVWVNSEGREIVVELARTPEGPVAAGLYELLLRPLPTLPEAWSARLRPARPGQIAVELNRQSGAGPQSVRVRFGQRDGRPVEFEIVDSAGDRYRLWVEETKLGFERPPGSF